MIRVKIVKKNKNKQKENEDSEMVAKIVIVDAENRVLMLVRSDFHNKYPGELDLPGGHIKKNENILKGLLREVKEETGLVVDNPIFYKQSERKYFYYTKYNSQPIKLSNEHKDFMFLDEKDLKSSDKFQKIALEVIGILKNG